MMKPMIPTTGADPNKKGIMQIPVITKNTDTI